MKLLILIDYAMKDVLHVIKEVMDLIIIVKIVQKIHQIIIFIILYIMKQENVLLKLKNIRIHV